MQEQINKFVKADDEKEGKCNISNLVEEDFLKNILGKVTDIQNAHKKDLTWKVQVSEEESQV